MQLGMCLSGSKIYLLFLPEVLKIFPYYSLKYHLLFPNYSAQQDNNIANYWLYSYGIKDIAQKVPYNIEKVD